MLNAGHLYLEVSVYQDMSLYQEVLVLALLWAKTGGWVGQDFVGTAPSEALPVQSCFSSPLLSKRSDLRQGLKALPALTCFSSFCPSQVQVPH